MKAITREEFTVLSNAWLAQLGSKLPETDLTGIQASIELLNRYIWGPREVQKEETDK